MTRMIALPRNTEDHKESGFLDQATHYVTVLPGRLPSEEELMLFARQNGAAHRENERELFLVMSFARDHAVVIADEAWLRQNMMELRPLGDDIEWLKCRYPMWGWGR